MLRNSVISEAQGRQLAKECGAIYVEASARDNVVGYRLARFGVRHGGDVKDDTSDRI